MTYTQDFPLPADDQYVGKEDLAEYGADIVEYNHLRVIIMQQFVDLPSFIQQLNTHIPKSLLSLANLSKK